MDSIANYCYRLGLSVFPHKMVAGTAANTLSETETTILGDEGTCGNSREGKEGNSDITYVSSVVLVFINPSTVIIKLVTWLCVG
jgi:hypothetical protein